MRLFMEKCCHSVSAGCRTQDTMPGSSPMSPALPSGLGHHPSSEEPIYSNVRWFPSSKVFQEHLTAWPRAAFSCPELCWDLKWDWAEWIPVGKGLRMLGRAGHEISGERLGLDTFPMWFLIGYNIISEPPYPSKGGMLCFLTLLALVRKKVSIWEGWEEEARKTKQETRQQTSGRST